VFLVSVGSKNNQQSIMIVSFKEGGFVILFLKLPKIGL